MGKHQKHRIHENTTVTYDEVKAWLGNRELMVLNTFLAADKPLTDREALHQLFPGDNDMNKVRPRITSLVESNVLEESDKRRCVVTGMMVRTCLVSRNIEKPGQQQLLLE
jgi:hypothetical protein